MGTSIWESVVSIPANQKLKMFGKLKNNFYYYSLRIRNSGKKQ